MSRKILALLLVAGMVLAPLSGISVSATPEWIEIGYDNPALIYTGAWSDTPQTLAGKTFKTASAVEVGVELTFYGSAIKIHVPILHPMRNDNIRVYLDGVGQIESQWATDFVSDTTYITFDGLEQGVHTLFIQAGTPISSDNASIDFWKVEVLTTNGTGLPSDGTSWKKYDINALTNSTNFYLSGKWEKDTSATATSNGRIVTRTKDSALEFKFKGTGVQLNAFLHENSILTDNALVYVDDLAPVRLAFYRTFPSQAPVNATNPKLPTVVWYGMAYQIMGLDDGMHTVKIVSVDDTDDSSYSGSAPYDFLFDSVRILSTEDEPMRVMGDQWTIVQDNDSDIKKVGGWSVHGRWGLGPGGNPTEDFKGFGTFTQSNTVGDYIEYEFVGTGIRYYGMQNELLYRNNNTRVYIDGEFQKSISQVGTPWSSQNFFEITGLTYGKHVIKIEVGATSSAAQTYSCVDYFEVLTGIDDFVRVDSSSISKINLNQTHTQGFNSTSRGDWWGNTLDIVGVSANESKDFFTWSFNGTGIRLGVRGIADSAVMKVTVDGVSHNVTGYYTNLLEQINIFTLVGLEDGLHTIKVESVSGNGGTSLWLDYVDVFVGDTSYDGMPSYQSVLVSADVVDAGAGTVKVVFTKALNFTAQANIYLDMGDAGTAPVSDIEYINGQQSGGKDYSNEIIFTFNLPTGIDALPDEATLVIQETISLNDGQNDLITKDMAVTMDNKSLSATTIMSGYDATTAPVIPTETEFVNLELVDEDAWLFRMEFNRPVHIGASSIYLCDNPDPNPGNGGSWQSGLGNLTYENPITIKGLEYAQTFLVNFQRPSHANAPVGLPTVAGVRIVEYGLGDNGNGRVSPIVVRDRFDRGLKANLSVSGGVDCAWQMVNRTGIETAFISADVIDAGAKVELNFYRPVRIADMAQILVGGEGWSKTVTSVSYENTVTVESIEYGSIVILTLDSAITAEDGGVTLSEAGTVSDGVVSTGTVVDMYDNAVTATGVKDGHDIAYRPFDKETDTTIDVGEDISEWFASGAAFSFMNCDTGRYLGANSQNEFSLIAAGGTNRFYLFDEESGLYLDIYGDTPALTATPRAIILIEATRQRYKIMADNGVVAAKDNDQGATNFAQLDFTLRNDLIENLWYITESGSQEPNRIMIIGDSITFGSDAELLIYEMVGCREELTAMLFEEDPLNRFVFVGSVRQRQGFESDTSLYRHEGHGGYVTKDVFGESNHPGFTDYIQKWLDKYAPDIALLQIGTNDCSQMTRYYDESTNNMTHLLERWQELADILLTALGEDGTLFAASVPPCSYNAAQQAYILRFNAAIEGRIEELRQAGENIVFCDNYSKINALGLSTALCSDGLHLSSAGHSAMAQSYFENIIAVYPTLGQDPPVVTSVTVATQPSKTTYYLNEELDLTGATLLVKYENRADATIAITADMLTGFDSTKPGEQTLTGTYEGFNFTITVTVLNAQSPGTGDLAAWALALTALAGLGLAVFLFLRRRKAHVSVR